MWCTRWFLPLVILPLPTAPPYFLFVFILSIVLHARPCFYCMLLLTALFTSSCYWQPLPINTSLIRPIGNATTFAEAIAANLTLPPGVNISDASSAVQLPPVILLIDRCWCSPRGMSSRGFFEPSDLSLWERASVERARRAFMRKVDSEFGRKVPMGEPDGSVNDAVEDGGSEGDGEPLQKSPTTFLDGLGRLRRLFTLLAPSNSSAPILTTDPEEAQTPRSNLNAKVDVPPQPRLRSYYDLRPYGLDMTVDFSWHRRR